MRTAHKHYKNYKAHTKKTVIYHYWKSDGSNGIGRCKVCGIFSNLDKIETSLINNYGFSKVMITNVFEL